VENPVLSLAVKRSFYYISKGSVPTFNVCLVYF
jgi:hypothetical protein